MDIIKRNFLLALRSGAFNEFVPFEPMSAYKWRVLLAVAGKQGVQPLAFAGVRSHQYDSASRVPQVIIAEITHQEASAQPSRQLMPSEIGAHQLTGSLAKRMEKIREEEMHAMDTSTETLELLNIITGVATVLLSSDTFVYALVELGQFLRNRGHLVDYVKLEEWLHRLRLDGLANLEASLLMSAFSFTADELPFATDLTTDTQKLLVRSLDATAPDDNDVWHFRETQVGLYAGNTAALSHKLGRSLHFARYAPQAVIRDLGASLIKSLKEIEE